MLLIALVGALIAMEIYLKRAIQGRLRANAEQLSEGASYAPGVTWSDLTTTTELSENATTNSQDDVEISTTKVRMNQYINRQESVMDFRFEPRRWD